MTSNTHEALVRDVEAGRRKLVREKIASVALACFLSGAGLLVLWRQRDPASVVLGALMLGGPPVVLALFARSQRRVWHADSNRMDDLFILEIERRADLARRTGLVYQLAPPALAAFLLCRWLTFQRGRASPT